ncbi:protease complex subunit PrcB family protein [Fulvivirga lutimaris]|uniref:protease complex subunit PrcB family protein n=1 Tax=Fulvivirga lutimaris TaxID=1819566 RepID=UPI0012BCE0A3|nr:protease complex subunit PrcB family protein [Fulvivirga lutimaris]MTI41402.1 hypothetical protein [Fulvivirga lutimaris]
MKKLLASFALLLVLSGCSTDGDPQLETFTTAIEPIIIGQGNLYGNGEENISKQNLLINNVDDWNQIISKMNTVNTETDNFSETDIDFSTHQIIAIFDDIKSTGGYSLELNLTQESQRIVAEITSQAFEGAAITVITQPYLIVSIPQSDLPVVFQ